MNYTDTIAGRVENEASKGGRFLTFAAVELRLVGAMETWWRMPDRESGWLHVKALWPDIQRFPDRRVIGGENDEQEAVTLPRRPAPTRDQIAEMVEASEWIAHAPERDRRLVAIVLALKAKGVRKVLWSRIWERLGRGRPGPDGLRKRYSRAITDIAQALSR
jgi:hypothetical protein